jgi:TRAP-type C4-dicarboxylate transport system substrate-binding protein
MLTTRLCTSWARLLIVLVAVMATGCGGTEGDDKAGGSGAPTTLRLAAADDAEQPDARWVRYFAAQVAELSGGSLRVRVTWDAGGQSADHEARIATMVRDGDFDLGWIGARSWDQVGVKSFQALQAPFLVTDHALLGRIATGPLGARMLEGLDDPVVGLALVQDRLRYAFGARRPLTSPEDFRGARLRMLPSQATETVLRALGAEPVQIDGDELAAAVGQGEIDGAEASLGTNSADEGENYVAGNVVLFAKALTLFGGSDALDALDDDDRDAVREAAAMTARYAAAHHPSESDMLREFCESGRAVGVVRAGPAELAALRRTAEPAFAELERDPLTRSLISEIEELKAGSAQDRVKPLPTCWPGHAVSTGEKVDASTLDGTYHWRVTRAGKIAAGGSDDDEDVGTIGTMTLRDGRWRMGDEDPEAYSGTFEIRGHRLVFDWGGTLLTFGFERDDDHGLHLTPIPPMDLGDAVVWAGGPWRYVGPPIRSIP